MAGKKLQSLDRSKQFKKKMTDGIRGKEGAVRLNETVEHEVIVKTLDVCSYEDFLKGLENDTNNLLSKAMKCGSKVSNYYNYQFGDIAMRVWWFEKEAGELPGKLLAYLVYHYLLGIKAYTSEKWKRPEAGKDTGHNLFPIWGKDGSKTGVVLNEYTVEDFMNDEENSLEQQARYELKRSMPYQFDEPIDGEDFELIHEVRFTEFNRERLYRLKDAFAQIASKGSKESLSSIATSLSVVMENYYMGGELDKDETVKSISKNGGLMKQWNKAQKEDFADFLNNFTSSLIPLNND